MLHGDLAGNMFHTSNGLYLIDFENAFVFDPLWEISSLCVRHNLHGCMTLFLSNYQLASMLDADLRIYNSFNVLKDTLWAYQAYKYYQNKESKQRWSRRSEYLYYNLQHIDNLDYPWIIV